MHSIPPHAGAGSGAGGSVPVAGKTRAAPMPGPLLNLQSGSDQDSLRLLSVAVSAELSGAGAALDCVVSLPRTGEEFLTAGTSDRAIGLTLWDQENGGPVSEAAAGQHSTISSYSSDPGSSAYWPPLGEAGYRALVTAPLALPGESAVLTLLAENDDAFPPPVLTRLTSFMAVAASSYALATELRTARRTAGRLRDTMQERTSIEVACGVIMGRKRCSYEAALQILAAASRHHNIKAMAAAEILLGELPGGAPTPHFAK